VADEEAESSYVVDVRSYSFESNVILIYHGYIGNVDGKVLGTFENKRQSLWILDPIHMGP